MQPNANLGLASEFESAKQLFFEGLQLLEANNLQGAETNFARSLDLMPERVSTLNNLCAVKIKLNKFAEAEQLARKAVALHAKSREAWTNLATTLTASRQLGEALDACARALSCNPSHGMAWLAKAIILRDLAQFEEALFACEEALKLESGRYEFLFQKSLLLNELGRRDEAREIYRKAMEIRIATAPVFIGDRRASQKAEILIISQNPDLEGSFTSFENLSRFCPNFPGQLADQFCEKFHFNHVFVGDALKSAVREQIPRLDFVINNHVNGEVLKSEGNLATLSQLMDTFGVPIVNHPSKAIATVRDLSSQLLTGLPGILVPTTTRFSSVGKSPDSLAQEIEDRFAFPLITRTMTSQEGQGMNKVDSREALLKVLSAPDCPQKFFVTQFVDSRGGNKFYRKIRAAVVKDEILIIRVDHDSFWKIYARKSDDRVVFYRNNEFLLEQECRIIKAPEATLGRTAMQSLRLMRQRIPLDVFGVDFDVDSAGQMVFYEANATMNLFSTARPEIPYPKEADDSLRKALCNYFESLVR